MAGLHDGTRDRIAALVQYYLVHPDGGMLLQSVGLQIGVEHSRHAIELTMDGVAVARLEWTYWWDRGVHAPEAHARWIAERLFLEWQQGAHRSKP